MNNFQKFISLPAITQRRILKTARRVAQDTHNRLDYMTIADMLTEATWESRQARRTAREDEARARWMAAR
jgi:hypothetical protein